MLCVSFAAIPAFEADPVGDDDIFCRNWFGLDSFCGRESGKAMEFGGERGRGDDYHLLKINSFEDIWLSSKNISVRTNCECGNDWN
jgi:hypothetical protein